MELSKDIQDAIARSLPSLAAGELKQFIEQGQKAIKDAIEFKARYEQEKNDREALERYRNEGSALLSRETEVNKKELRLAHHGELLKLREELMNHRLDDLKEITRTVFQSNRFDYSTQINGSIPVSSGNGGYPINMPVNMVSTTTGLGA